MKKHRFSAVIESAGGGGAFVIVPFDVEKAFGKKRVPVHATIDGVPYRGSLVRYGRPEHMLGVLKDIRREIGKDIGDAVDVVVWEDREERVVEIPAAFAEALRQNPAAKERFERLSYTHQREHVNFINEGKKEETRLRRIVKTVENLSDTG